MGMTRLAAEYSCRKRATLEDTPHPPQPPGAMSTHEVKEKEEVQLPSPTHDPKQICVPAVKMEERVMRRHTLKREEKLKILEERDRRMSAGLTVRQSDLMQWAKDEFGLESAPSQSAMSRILCTKDKTELMSMPKVRRNRGGKLPELEETLAKWVRAQQAARIIVKGESVKQKGKSYLDAINASLPPGEQLSMQFSTGWLCNFQRRWNLRLTTREQKEDLARFEDMDQLEQVIGRAPHAMGPEEAFVPQAADGGDIGASLALPLKRGADALALEGSPSSKLLSPNSRRERIPFWFIGLEKLTDVQFATRLVNFICKRVEMTNKHELLRAARTSAMENGIDGATAVLGSNDNDQIAEVLLDDFQAVMEEKEAIIAAGKQFFVDLELIVEGNKQLQQLTPLEKKQKQEPAI